MRMLGRVSLCILGVLGFGGLTQAQAADPNVAGGVVQPQPQAQVQGMSQALKQLPADPMVVLKVNNPDAVSAKAGKMMQQLGLVSFLPDLKDPIGFLKKEVNIKDGFDGKGDMAVGLYFDLENARDVKGVFIIPVTDYAKFTGNLAKLKNEGDGVSSFVFTEGAETMYVASRGKYAAISNDKATLGKPAGSNISSAAAVAQLDTADVALYTNTQKLAAMPLPMIKQQRPELLSQLEKELNREPSFDKKFVPVVKELANQALNLVEDILTDTTSATISAKLTDKGVVFTTVADFNGTGKIGSAVSTIKSSGDVTLAGLPQAKYFATAAVAMDMKPVVDFISGYLDPVSRELTTAGDNGKKFQEIYESMKKSQLATSSSAMGFVMPTGPVGQQSVLQELFVVKGDVATIKALQDKSIQASMELSNMLQGAVNSGMTTEMKIDKGAVKIAGGSFDRITAKFTVDPANPAAQQIKQTLDLMYGPNGLTGVQGEVDAKTFVVTMGCDDKLTQSLVASAKANSTAFAQSSMIKAASGMLPAQKLGVMYVHPDNIANTVVAYLSSMGMRVPFKMTEDTTPMGISISTEGPALRMDMAFPNDLIESIVVSVRQVIGDAINRK